jgi:hypothetical protein
VEGMILDDIERQWDLVSGLLAALEFERVLARNLPLAGRWQLDRLIESMKHMDRLFKELDELQEAFLEEMDA